MTIRPEARFESAAPLESALASLLRPTPHARTKGRARLRDRGLDASWVGEWRGLKIFVLGDVMLDRFVYGTVARISPEAPIPILHRQSETSMLGGAGNVARNIVALGGEALLVGALGADAEGDLVAGPLISSDRIESRFLRAADCPTTAKTRYVSGGQQIMRLDVERRFHPSAQDIETICGWLLEAMADVSAIVLSDYAKGVLVPTLIRRVIGMARARAIPVIVDPKSRDVARYAGATVLTPNAAEAAAVAGVERLDDGDAGMAAKILRERAQVDAVVVTRGAQGVTVYDPDDPGGSVAHAPTAALEVFDVSGAGDTLVAALALALGAGASVKTAARIGNAAAGVAVGKRGTAIVQARELSAALGGARAGDDPKIVDNERAAAIVRDWRGHGLKIGFANGCFDLIHPGHIELLRRSRAACDRLIVALNTDASVRRLKGETRPVQNERARAAVMAAIDCVNLVTLFDEDTPIRLIERLTPDCLIKGDDYIVETVVGADFVRSYGGSVILVPLERGHSTTSIIARASAGAIS
jgi:D-beta-D-heptose 7-phosphate kinase/D-beta-D-heptose 1-phosphate adenosyltransferase